MDFDLNEKKILVIGLGRSGVAASKLLLQKGALVKITEANDNYFLQIRANELRQLGIDVELGGHTQEFIADRELVVTSPGILPQAEIFTWLQKRNIPVISELELGSYFLACPLIGVTGTNGKSTVTSLIAHFLRTAGQDAIACGNIGLPLTEVVLANRKIDYAVVEISSFQLQFTKRLHVQTAVWLNFSYDHLDYHNTMEEYLTAKLRIFSHQKALDWAVVRYDQTAVLDEVCHLASKRVLFGLSPHLNQQEQNSVGLIDGWIKINLSGKQDSCLFHSGRLRGVHNLENILAAVAVAKIYGVANTDIEKALRTFQPLAYRFQNVASIRGVDFINDSKSTNLDSVIVALNSLDGSAVLVLGGKDKGDDFAKLKDHLAGKVSHIVAVGEAQQRIWEQLREVVPVNKTASFEEAITIAFQKAIIGTNVLFSPGCSSFDMFRDYKERGDTFNTIINQLKIKNKEERRLAEGVV